MHYMYTVDSSDQLSSLTSSSAFLTIPRCSVSFIGYSYTAIVDHWKHVSHSTILSSDSGILTQVVATLWMFVWAECFELRNGSIFSFSRHFTTCALALQTDETDVFGQHWYECQKTLVQLLFDFLLVEVCEPSIHCWWYWGSVGCKKEDTANC